ncbi:MAG: hybrid sensor histidine kinase/response regulator [Deltaproteobacteria bacterium]|nr:hybrid sensor histidine kinase/response regulator [Deltaproteobacteria bacterium]
MTVGNKHTTKRRILIVDDVVNNCLLIEDHLRSTLKCEFRIAYSGKEALKILEDWVPDCILMDIMMPEMNGIETTQLIKRIPECHDVPVLMVTAKQEMESLEESFDAGAVDYIYKPIDRTTLVARTKSALRSKDDIDRIKELNKELFQKKEELSSFSHTVSHDLKSPVVGAASLFDFFLMRIKEEHPQIIGDESLKEILDRIPKAFHKMLDFINTQLDYAEAGQVIGKLESISMNKLISAVIENFEHAEREGMVLFSELPEMPKTKCDSIRMLKVWQNLVANSIKYRGDRHPVRIDFGVQENVESVKFWIRDDGPGIYPEYQQKVFETSARLNYDVDGYGFGLATVKKIIEAHGGKIWIDSEITDGACFVFEIPQESVIN